MEKNVGRSHPISHKIVNSNLAASANYIREYEESSTLKGERACIDRSLRRDFEDPFNFVARISPSPLTRETTKRRRKKIEKRTNS